MTADGASDAAVAELLATCTPDVRGFASKARALIHEVVPDAVEELDRSAQLIGYTFIPGTYKGLFAAIALQRDYINIMFSNGVELQAMDQAGLLQGTGKRARHVKVRRSEELDDPGLTDLIKAAADRTPR